MHLGVLTSRPAVSVAAAATVVTVAAAHHNKEHILRFRPQLNSTVIEAISGAAGEVAQIALVYPLDTIKVRCQAAGSGSRAVVSQLWGATKGNWPAFLSALYAGAAPAALLSIVVGSVHYCCFCATRRTLARLTAAGGSSSSSTSGAGGGQLTGPAAAGQDDHRQQQQQQQRHHNGVQSQHVIVSHGATGTHFLPLDESLCGSEDNQEQQQQQQSLSSPLLDEQQQQQQQLAGTMTTSSSSSRGSAADGSLSTPSSSSSASTAAAGVVGGSAGRAAESHSGDSAPESVAVAEGSLLVNCCAAVLTAALTALVESPLELFRHNSQAGHIQGNFLLEMGKALRKSGPRSLYYGFLPYCLESLPYDITELLVVGAAKDLRQQAAVQHISATAYDLCVGGLAGGIAVLVSMPFDVIKTYIQTHGAVGAAAAASAVSGGGSVSCSSSISGNAGLFLSTGKALVAKGGPQALFVGLAPRLAHQVPGAMICWLVIESVHRVLTKECLKRTNEPAARHQQPAAAA